MSREDIVVVGAGPHGLTVAAELLRFGVPCRVVEQSHRETGHSRAIGVSARSLEVFEELGAADEIVAAGIPIGIANFYSRGRVMGRLTTSAVGGTKFPFILALPQYETERILRKRFADMGGHIDSGMKLVDLAPGSHGAPNRLTFEGPRGTEEIEAKWVIGADGSRSVVRDRSRIAMNDAAMTVSFTIVDAFAENGPARDEGHYFFSPDGLLVIVPLPDGAYRFAATIPASSAEDSTLDLDHLRDLVAMRSGLEMRVSNLRDAGWGGSKVRIQPRIASTLRAGGCLIGGDAAHIFSPVGGQGMNAAVQDAHNLAWKLALVCRGDAPEALLDSYSAERLPIAQALMKASNAQTKLATIGSSIGRAARDFFLRFATRTGRLDQKMAPTLTQLAIDYAGSSPAAPERRSKDDPTGRRLPNAALSGGNRMHALLGRRPFSVVALLGAGGDTEADALTAHVEKTWRDRVAVVRVGRAGASGGEAPVDAAGELAAFAPGSAGTVLVVRPDGHVVASAALGDWRSAIGRLENILNRPLPGGAAAPVAEARDTANT